MAAHGVPCGSTAAGEGLAQHECLTDAGSMTSSHTVTQSPDHGCRRALALATAHTSDAVVYLGTRMAWQVR